MWNFKYDRRKGYFTPYVLIITTYGVPFEYRKRNERITFITRLGLVNFRFSKKKRSVCSFVPYCAFNVIYFVVYFPPVVLVRF